MGTTSGFLTDSLLDSLKREALMILMKKNPEDYFCLFQILISTCKEEWWKVFGGGDFARNWASLYIRPEKILHILISLTLTPFVNTRWLHLTGYLPHNQKDPDVLFREN